MEQTVGAPASDCSMPSSRSISLLPRLAALFLIVLLFISCSPNEPKSTLRRIKSSGVLVYGSDKEGAAHTSFPTPRIPAM